MDVISEVQSGGKRDRPALASVLERMRTHEADALVVAKYDRVARSTLHFVTLLDAAEAEGWALVALDSQLDTTTPGGRFAAEVLGSAAAYERALIRARVREGIAAKKQQGSASAGSRASRTTSGTASWPCARAACCSARSWTS